MFPTNLISVILDSSKPQCSKCDPTPNGQYICLILERNNLMFYNLNGRNDRELIIINRFRHMFCLVFIRAFKSFIIKKKWRAFPLKTGSTNMVLPLIVSRYEECPNHTITGSFACRCLNSVHKRQNSVCSTRFDLRRLSFIIFIYELSFDSCSVCDKFHNSLFYS